MWLKWFCHRNSKQRQCSILLTEPHICRCCLLPDYIGLIVSTIAWKNSLYQIAFRTRDQNYPKQSDCDYVTGILNDLLPAQIYYPCTV